MWLGGIWTAKIKPQNNYVKLYNSLSFWDTVTKVRSKYSLRRPLSETHVILNFERIFRLQNGRRREVSLVFFAALWHWASVQYNGIVYTRIINMWLGGIWTAKIKPENNYVNLYKSAKSLRYSNKSWIKIYLTSAPLWDTRHFKFWTNISATKRPPKGSSSRLFAVLWHWASTIERHCVHTDYKYVAGMDLNCKNKAWK